jgi:hypothetical protein
MVPSESLDAPASKLTASGNSPLGGVAVNEATGTWFTGTVVVVVDVVVVVLVVVEVVVLVVSGELVVVVVDVDEVGPGAGIVQAPATSATAPASVQRSACFDMFVPQITFIRIARPDVADPSPAPHGVRRGTRNVTRVGELGVDDSGEWFHGASEDLRRVDAEPAHERRQVAVELDR